MNLSDMAVMTTACRRPYYLRETLRHWEQARGIEQVQGFHVALGQSDRETEMVGALNGSTMLKKPGIMVLGDPRPGMGMHAAIGAMGQMLFSSPAQPGFVVFGEEDVLVSDDVLEYMAWAATEFQHDQRVAAVCAHSVGGQHWDTHEPADDADASQAQVRLLPYFNAWAVGVWADRWPMFYDQWDWDCTSGNGHNGYSGWDFNIATRILPRNNKVCVVPDASRSQNIGRLEGWASNEWSFSFSQAQSFRPHRKPAEYELVDASAPGWPAGRSHPWWRNGARL